MSKKKVAVAGAAVALCVALAGGSTLAYFSATDESVNNFQTGAIAVTVNESNGMTQTNEEYAAWLADQKLVPGSKTQNAIAKQVTVTNNGTVDAYLWAEIWIPAALDDGDDNSPAAPGLGNNLHFNYSRAVTETPASYLGSKEIDGVAYNGYVHYITNSAPIKADGVSEKLLDQVYMDSGVKMNPDGEGYLLQDGETVYSGTWNLKVIGVGMQADGFVDIKDAIDTYYNKK